MIDLTPIIQAIIALAASAITVFLIPWLKTRFGNEKLETVKNLVHIAVYGAEKLFGAKKGNEKLEYVEKFLAEHKIVLDTYELMAMVNAEIKKMEQAELLKVDTVIEPPAYIEPPDGEPEPSDEE